MIRSPLRLIAALALVALTLFVVACGGDDASDSGSTDKASNGSPTEGKKGGKLEVLSASDVDFLDPGQTYFTGGYEVAYVTQRPLYSFKPGEKEAHARPRRGRPEISDDKKTVSVTIKKGVKFGPPVDREIQAKDVKYAFERAFTKNVPNQYTTYFNFIEGAKESAAPARRSRGSRSTRRSVQDHVQAHQGAGRRVRRGPRDADHHAGPEGVRGEVGQAVAVDVQRERRLLGGPYMVENDAQGKVIGYKPGKTIHLVRNPNWVKDTDYRPAYLDEILIRTNATDGNVTGRQVLEGSTWCSPTNPPAQVLKRVVQRQKDQLKTRPGRRLPVLPLTTTIKPLDDINVRKAITAAFDRDAARKARGGEFVGPIATHFIPPGINGFEEAGGEKGPGFDFLANPKGDMAVAEKYMKAAGYSSGKYDGTEELLMVGANVDPGKAQAEVAKAQFEKLGFKIRLRTVPQDAVYNEWCQQPAKKVAVCGGAAWFKDFNDPQSMLEPAFKGSTISWRAATSTTRQLDDPKIDKAMDEAALLEGEERYQAWGEIDKMITEQAPAVPFVWDNTNLIHSKDVNGVSNEY